MTLVNSLGTACFDLDTFAKQICNDKQLLSVVFYQNRYFSKTLGEFSQKIYITELRRYILKQTETNGFCLESTSVVSKVAASTEVEARKEFSDH